MRCTVRYPFCINEPAKALYTLADCATMIACDTVQVFLRDEILIFIIAVLWLIKTSTVMLKSTVLDKGPSGVEACCRVLTLEDGECEVVVRAMCLGRNRHQRHVEGRRWLNGRNRISFSLVAFSSALWTPSSMTMTFRSVFS